MIVRVNSHYPIEDMIEFCNAAIDIKKPATINLETDDWENNPHTLLYALYIERRYDGDRSGYLVCRENDKVVAGAGWSPCVIDPQMYVQSRSFVVNSMNFHRLSFAISDYAFYSQYKGGVLTFEPHNYEFMMRLVDLQAAHAFDPYYEKDRVCGRVFRHTYKKQKTRCLPLMLYPAPVNYRYCKQFLVAHFFDENYRETFVRKVAIHETV